MKMICLLAATAFGIAVPALAQPQSMSGSGAPGAGMHPSSPATGSNRGQGMSPGRQSDGPGAGMQPNDRGPGMENGDMVVPHHPMNGRGPDDNRMGMGHPSGMGHRHCRTVWRHHHRVRRCM